MDNALLLYLKKLEAKIDGLDVDITTLNNTTFEIKATVADILNGTQLSEWMADLEAAGKSSTTYGDYNRMNTLVSNDVACKNTNINQHIFDWSVTNNKVGTFFSTAMGGNWSSLTTCNAVYKNSSAFSSIANNENMFTIAMNNTISKNSMYSSYNVTESIIAGSSTALKVLDGMKTKKRIPYTSGGQTTISIGGFVLTAGFNEWPGMNSNRGTLNARDSSSISMPTRSGTINKFIIDADCYVYNDSGGSINYVDF